MRPTPGRRATRNDVAELAGVSTAVVSHVLNDTKPVSPATAAKVRKAVAELGYRPNQTARALRLGSSEVFGMLVPDSSNPFFTRLCHAVEVVVTRRGYDLVTANADSTGSLERRHLESFVSRRVDGVFFSSVYDDPDVNLLRDVGIPFVLLNHSNAIEGVDSIGVDLRMGARIGVEHLVAHGHREIGLVVGRTAAGTIDPRETGWREVLAAHGLSGSRLEVDFTIRGGYDAGVQLRNAPERPRAVFVSSDRQAVGLLRAFHEVGLRVPDDIAVVSFDGWEDAEFSWPPLTTVAQPIDVMAAAAVHAMFDHDPARVKQHHLFEPSLVRRATCGCAAATEVVVTSTGTTSSPERPGRFSP